MHPKTPARDQTFVAAVLDIQERMRDLVLRAARKAGSVRLRVAYADNFWTVEVASDGTTKYDGYAEEARGPTGDLTDLTLWELASILETL